MPKATCVVVLHEATFVAINCRVIFARSVSLFAETFLVLDSVKKRVAWDHAIKSATCFTK